jgi:hypothetical protein
MLLDRIADRYEDLSDIGIGLRSARPAANAGKRLYLCTDTGETFMAVGGSWIYMEGAKNASLSVGRLDPTANPEFDILQSIGNGTGFTTVELGGATHQSLSDPGSNFNTSTHEYTVPVTGTYQIITKLRLMETGPSGVPGGISFGHGAGTSNADGPHFHWFVTVGDPLRNGSMNVRIAPFSAGNTIKMYAYVDSATPRAIFGMAMDIAYLSS